MKKILNKRQVQHLFYALLIVVFVFMACSGDNEAGVGLTEWLKQPITEMSIMELIFVIFIVGLITDW